MFLFYESSVVSSRKQVDKIAVINSNSDSDFDSSALLRECTTAVPYLASAQSYYSTTTWSIHPIPHFIKAVPREAIYPPTAQRMQIQKLTVAWCISTTRAVQKQTARRDNGPKSVGRRHRELKTVEIPACKQLHRDRLQGRLYTEVVY